jgi:multicomponent Na+:H+ antiporter subunit E
VRRATLVQVVWLVAVWTALWGSITPANVLGGVAAAAVVVRLFPARTSRDPVWVVRPLATLRFALWFGWKLVEANVVMLWEVLTPTDHTRPGVVAVPISPCSPGIVTLIANAISLTPGTLTLDVQGSPPVLYIHVMHLDDPATVRRDVGRLEALVVAAFGSGLDPTPTEEDRSWT